MSKLYRCTIRTTQKNAKVLLNGVETKSVSVEEGTIVKWVVSKTGYATNKGEVEIGDSNFALTVSLQQDKKGFKQKYYLKFHKDEHGKYVSEVIELKETLVPSTLGEEGKYLYANTNGTTEWKEVQGSGGDVEQLKVRMTTAESNILSLNANKANTTYVNTELAKKQNIVPNTITSTDAYGYLDVFCNGIPVVIEAGDDSSSIKIYYDNHTKYFLASKGSTRGVRVYGGCGDLGFKTYLPTTSVIVNGGRFSSLFGGSINSGYVGVASVTVNGGYIEGGVGAGRSDGSNPETQFHDNTVGLFNLLINDCQYLLAAYGASNGYSTVNRSYVEINGGNVQYAIAAAANGNSSYIEYVVNGGTLNVLQSHSRGTNGKVKMTVNGGSISELYAGAELEETTPCKYQFLEMHLLGGTIAKTVAGSRGTAGVADISKLSGTYKTGVIANDAGNLTSKLKLV